MVFMVFTFKPQCWYVPLEIHTWYMRVLLFKAANSLLLSDWWTCNFFFLEQRKLLYFRLRKSVYLLVYVHRQCISQGVCLCVCRPDKVSACPQQCVWVCSKKQHFGGASRWSIVAMVSLSLNWYNGNNDCFSSHHMSCRFVTERKHYGM